MNANIGMQNLTGSGVHKPELARVEEKAEKTNGNQVGTAQ